MALNDLIRQGKILYWGTQTWNSTQLRQVHQVTFREKAYAPIVNYALYNLHERGIEYEVMKTCQELGMGLITWSPFAGGTLAGKTDQDFEHMYSHMTEEDKQYHQEWLRPWTDPLSKNHNQLFWEFAHSFNLPPSHLALRWILNHSPISSIVFHTLQQNHLHENLDLFKHEISKEIFQKLDRLFL